MRPHLTVEQRPLALRLKGRFLGAAKTLAVPAAQLVGLDLGVNGSRSVIVQGGQNPARSYVLASPKELRTSFVSMMSYQGVPVQEIARLAGHASSRTTEVIYRRELRPVITTGAEVMDRIFRRSPRRRTADSAVG